MRREQWTMTDLEDAILAYGEGRTGTRNAMAQQKFLEASAQLWSAERALDELAAVIRRQRQAGAQE